jgi:hypothetical protein
MVWIDDVRIPPPPFSYWIQSSYVQHLEDVVRDHAHEIEGLSFDHDLGDTEFPHGSRHPVDGTWIVNRLEWLIRAEGLRFPMLRTLTVHTANASRQASMRQACGSIAAHAGSSHIVSVASLDYDATISEIEAYAGVRIGSPDMPFLGIHRT